MTDAGRGEFRFQAGPIFANLILADEVNRSPAKVQAALLEAMEERQVTVGGQTTQARAAVPGDGDAEPDRAGGHLSAARGADGPLPDACERGLPRGQRGGRDHPAGAQRGSAAAAGRMVAPPAAQASRPSPCSRRGRPSTALPSVRPVERYIVALVQATRDPGQFDDDLKRWIQVGVSPRGSIGLDKVARAIAWLRGRDHVTPGRCAGRGARRVPPSADPVLRGPRRVRQRRCGDRPPAATRGRGLTATPSHAARLRRPRPHGRHRPPRRPRPPRRASTST